MLKSAGPSSFREASSLLLTLLKLGAGAMPAPADVEKHGWALWVLPMGALEVELERPPSA